MAKKPVQTRPQPPQNLDRFMPAPEVLEWIGREVLAEDGRIHNPEHSHLIGADFEVLWAPVGFTRQMRTVIGQAEEVMIRAGGWQKMRQEEQLIAWFGRVPSFIITLDASYAAHCSDAEWCALVEHEMYHLAHKRDDFGAPAFTKEGRPKLCIRGHDVEEFVGVVRRYGVGDPGGAIAQLARAAGNRPEVSTANIAGSCGTCMMKAA